MRMLFDMTRDEAVHCGWTTLILTPYNAQVSDLSNRIPDVRVGTVDKFQGQQAPVVIYSLTTSSPRGCAARNGTV